MWICHFKVAFEFARVFAHERSSRNRGLDVSLLPNCIGKQATIRARFLVHRCAGVARSNQSFLFFHCQTIFFICHRNIIASDRETSFSRVCIKLSFIKSDELKILKSTMFDFGRVMQLNSSLFNKLGFLSPRLKYFGTSNSKPWFVLRFFYLYLLFNFFLNIFARIYDFKRVF